jgi:polysaccharide pyruvyl transferase WcaK-like protein
VWALSAFPGDDRHIIEMMRRADAPDLPYLAAHDDPDAGVGLLASAELVVAERLHGAVLAAAAGTVPVMVEYRPKLRDFAESVGLGELVIKTDALGGGALVELTDSAYRRRSELAARMSANVNRLRNRQVKAAEEIEKALR